MSNTKQPAPEKLPEVPESWTGVKAHPRRKRFPWFFAGLLTFFLAGTLLCAVLLVHVLSSPYEVRYETASAAVPEDSSVLSWEEKNPCEQYPEFRFSGLQYTASGLASDEGTEGDYLGGGTLTATDSSGEEHREFVSIYTVPGIAQECAVSVTFSDGVSRYIYLSADWHPDTLAELVSGLNLSTTMETGTVFYNYRDKKGTIHDVRFDGVGTEIILTQLLSDLTLSNVSDYSSRSFGRTIMTVEVNVPSLGISGGSLWTTEDGWLCTDLLSAEKAFFIGTDAVEAFTKYIDKRFDGYEVVITEIPAE